jgi:hypothetical protein
VHPHRIATCFVLLILVSVGSEAKDPPPQVIVWPSSGPPVLRFALGKPKEIGSGGGTRGYSIDVTAENQWGKRIARADFSLYLLDKNKVRIGDGYISITDVAPGGIVKLNSNVQASGIPVSMELSPLTLPSELQSYLPLKKVSITVNSVPQGADVKLDGVQAGTTPKIIQVAPGKHILEFSKEGFKTGNYPLEITPEETSGGSVSYELGTSAHDTVELRDGSVISGDLESVSPTEVVVRIGGTLQRLSRSQVKRIALIERDAPSQ